MSFLNSNDLLWNTKDDVLHNNQSDLFYTTNKKKSTVTLHTWWRSIINVLCFFYKSFEAIKFLILYSFKTECRNRNIADKSYKPLLWYIYVVFVYFETKISLSFHYEREHFEKSAVCRLVCWRKKEKRLWSNISEFWWQDFGWRNLYLSKPAFKLSSKRSNSLKKYYLVCWYWYSPAVL